MVGALKWVFPLYWPVGLAKATVSIPSWGIRTLYKAGVAAWNKLPKPKSTLGKAIVYPLYLWIAIPGTVPWSLFQIGKLIGFEAELTELYTNTLGFLGDAAFVTADLAGKILFYAMVSLGGAAL